MYPLLKEGEYVICELVAGGDKGIAGDNMKFIAELKEKLSENPLKKSVYVIETKDEGLLIKYLEKIEDNQLILSSDNNSYAIIKLPLENVHAIRKAKKVHSLRDI